MIAVALGANLPSRFGSPAETLDAAKNALEKRNIMIAGSSGTWLSAPVPVSDQPWYHNAVVSVRTDAGPQELLRLLHDIEHEFGRVRTTRNAPRLLDLDLIDHDGQVIDEDGFTLPHPRMHERAFVLLPLKQVAPGWVHPVSGRSIDDLIASIPVGQNIRLAEALAA